MCKYRVKQDLLNSSSHEICYWESFAESKFDAKFVNTAYQVCVFKINRMFGTKHSETN